MNIFDMEVYASRCQNPHLQKKVPSRDAGHLRNYFNERGLATKLQRTCATLVGGPDESDG